MRKILPVLILLMLLTACALREATPSYSAARTETALSPESANDPVQPIAEPDGGTEEGAAIPEDEETAGSVPETEAPLPEEPGSRFSPAVTAQTERMTDRELLM